MQCCIKPTFENTDYERKRNADCELFCYEKRDGLRIATGRSMGIELKVGGGSAAFRPGLEGYHIYLITE
jgi:hypothetical protein